MPLTTARADGFTDAQREARLSLLLEEYGANFTATELVPVVVERLRELALLTDRLADELGNPELHEHARVYREDAARLGEARS